MRNSLTVAALVAVTSSPIQAASDPKATAIAQQVIEALGGSDAWNATQYLRFDFAVDRGGKTVARRSHTWDKYTGRYRIEGKNKEGKSFLVLMNLNTKEGSAWLDGAPQTGEDLKKLLESGYGMWVNDTYWLLMPYKLGDAGVSLSLDGVEKGKDATWDKLLLTFDNVGLTPKDKYWAFVNRDTHLVDRWDFVLMGEKVQPSGFEWKGWKSYGRIKLADDRVSKGGTRIYFPVLDVPQSVDDAVFSKP